MRRQSSGWLHRVWCSCSIFQISPSQTFCNILFSDFQENSVHWCDVWLAGEMSVWWSHRETGRVVRREGGATLLCSLQLSRQSTSLPPPSLLPPLYILTSNMLNIIQTCQAIHNTHIVSLQHLQSLQQGDSQCPCYISTAPLTATPGLKFMQQSLQNIDSDRQEELETEVGQSWLSLWLGSFRASQLITFLAWILLLSFSLIVFSLQSDSLLVYWRKQHNCVELRWMRANINVSLRFLLTFGIIASVNSQRTNFHYFTSRIGETFITINLLQCL